METKEIKINNYNSIKINLEQKLNNLDEVNIKAIKKNKSQKIYTAFGAIDLRGVGYRVYSINMLDIKNSAAELPQLLIGRIPIIYDVTNQGIILRRSGAILRRSGAILPFALWDIDGMLFDGLPP